MDFDPPFSLFDFPVLSPLIWLWEDDVLPEIELVVRQKVGVAGCRDVLNLFITEHEHFRSDCA